MRVQTDHKVNELCECWYVIFTMNSKVKYCKTNDDHWWWELLRQWCPKQKSVSNYGNMNERSKFYLLSFCRFPLCLVPLHEKYKNNRRHYNSIWPSNSIALQMHIHSNNTVDIPHNYTKQVTYFSSVSAGLIISIHSPDCSQTLYVINYHNYFFLSTFNESMNEWTSKSSWLQTSPANSALS